MFVEQLTWNVPSGGKESALRVLSMLHHHMDASGGLIKSLTGCDTGGGSLVLSLTFWKSWEDLSRFLAGPKASLLDEAQSVTGSQSIRPHHYEIVREWPSAEVDTVCGESHWMIHEFHASDDGSQALFDALGQTVPRLGHEDGFRRAELWLDKNNSTHVVLASQWSGDLEPDRRLVERLMAGGSGPGVSSCTTYKMRVSDPYHLGVA